MTKPSQKKKPSGIAISREKTHTAAKKKAKLFGKKFTTLKVKSGPFKGPWVIKK